MDHAEFDDSIVARKFARRVHTPIPAIALVLTLALGVSGCATGQTATTTPGVSTSTTARRCPTYDPAKPAIPTPDAWDTVRALLPPGTTVMEPRSLPAGLDNPAVQEACVDGDGVPQYTVTYVGSGRSLVFILNFGTAAWGNSPPPSTVDHVDVNGTDATVTSFQNAATGSILIEVSWRLGEARYWIRANSFDKDAVVQVAKDTMVPVPASSTAASGGATPSTTAAPTSPAPEPTSTVPISVVQEATDGSAASQVQFTSAKEAAADASKKAGFTIVSPSGVPDGYQLVLIDISPAARNGLLRARLRFAREGQTTLTLLQVNTPFQLDGADAEHTIATPGPGATIYRVASDIGTEYTLLTPKHGYTLTVLAPEPIDQAAAVKLLSALPLD